MPNPIKLFYLNLNKKLISSILLIVVVPIITLRLLGLLQWIEWAMYDSLFYFSPSEPSEPRIVVVAWNEEDLRRTSSFTLSDQLLSSVLKKIQASKPSVIGLDLYRDIPVPSKLLDKRENEIAYNRLLDIFGKSPNLIGIEKVTDPMINPPKVLLEKGRVLSSDLITDSDNIIRRSFIDPQPLLKEGEPAEYKSVPYLGIVLGTEYLALDGWKAKIDKNGSLRISKANREIILENLKNYDGGYINNRKGLDFLVNWRRGDDLFETISIGELMNGGIRCNYFKDKIVLIGNIAASTADRHYLPIRRWDKKQLWTEGVYIPAHVASSIISAANENRPTLKVAPWGIGYILLILAIFSISQIVFRFSQIPTRKLYGLSGLFGLGLTGLIYQGSLFAFLHGWWIPIVPSLLGVWLTWIWSNNYLQIEKEQKNVLKLTLISTYLDHKLGNLTNLIQLSSSGIKRLSDKVYDNLFDDYKEGQRDGYYEENYPFSATENGKSLEHIQGRTARINDQIELITQYRERTTRFIDLTSSTKIKNQIFAEINDFVKQLVKTLKQEKKSQYEYFIEIKEIYDNSLLGQKIDTLVVEIILENLLDNAFYAVNPELNPDKNHVPSITIQTKKRKERIEMTIEDNGSGIPKIKQKEIFESFVSFKSDRGQGIGLALVKEILTLQQGEIKVESQLGRGSKFTVYLPRKISKF